jgi:hypothetical protein
MIPFATMGLVYVGSAVLIGAWISRRGDTDGVGLVLSSAILAVFPAVIIWSLFLR